LKSKTHVETISRTTRQKEHQVELRHAVTTRVQFPVRRYTALPFRESVSDKTADGRRAARALAAVLVTPAKRKLHSLRFVVVAWSSGNPFYPIEEVTIRRAWLLLGWVTACEQVNHFGM